MSKAKVERKHLEKIIKALESIEYGLVQIYVHNANIIQIEKVEKYRFPLEKKASNNES